MADDLHTYRIIRKIYLSQQRKFYQLLDRNDSLGYARHDRIKQLLRLRRKYAPSLTNGRYDELSCIRRTKAHA